MNFMRNPGKQIQVAHTLTATIDGRCAARNSLRKTREYKVECQRGGMDTSLSSASRSCTTAPPIGTPRASSRS